MLQIILHGIGDYFLQTDYQAMNKKKAGLKGFLACFTHCLFYSVPFFIIGNWKQVLFIFITHFIVDRTNLVAQLLAFRNRVKSIDNFGFCKEKPFAVAFWLYVICDNIIHISCNYFALKYL